MSRRLREFARLITRVEDLPERLRNSYEESLGYGPHQLAIYAPPISNMPGRHVQPVAGYLLMNFQEHLDVAVDRAGEPVKQIRIPFIELMCIEFGQILLFSWVKFVFGEGPITIKIPFNTVMERLFVETVNSVRKAVNATLSDSNYQPVVTNLEFKFQNVIARTLLPNEVLLGFAFQPELRTRRLLLLERQLVPPLLAVVTNSEFFTVTEEPPVAAEKLGRFSEIYTYCRHAVIESVTTNITEDQRFTRLQLNLRHRNVQYSTSWKLTTAVVPQFDALCSITNDLVTHSKHESPNTILVNA